jgi:hypothetical protein
MPRQLEFTSLLERANAAVERAHYLVHRTRDLIEQSSRLQNEDYLLFDNGLSPTETIARNRTEIPLRFLKPVLPRTLQGSSCSETIRLPTVLTH